MEIIKQNLIGARLEHIRIDRFIKYGIPIPLYTQKQDLLLLFRNDDDCKNYLHKLEVIKNEMEEYDPDKKKINIQDTIAFINSIVLILNCGN